jgi:16S rRNA (guanine966-N2)-methyltransferase
MRLQPSWRPSNRIFREHDLVLWWPSQGVASCDRRVRDDGRVTRIIAGVAGGRRIETPRGSGTRPTSDRVREALFAALDARGAVDGAVVLDLFAGSGALGLEAASRGASEVVLVDDAREAVAVARRNAAALGLDGVRVVQAPVLRWLSGPEPPPADLVLLDPPYALDEDALATVLRAVDRRCVAPGALVVVERDARSPEPSWPGGGEPEGSRRYGDTVLWTAAASVPA